MTDVSKKLEVHEEFKKYRRDWDRAHITSNVESSYKFVLNYPLQIDVIKGFVEKLEETSDYSKAEAFHWIVERELNTVIIPKLISDYHEISSYMSHNAKRTKRVQDNIQYVLEQNGFFTAISSNQLPAYVDHALECLRDLDEYMKRLDHFLGSGQLF